MDIKLKSSDAQKYLINGMLMVLYGYILILGYSEGRLMGISFAIAIILIVVLVVKEIQLFFTIIALNRLIKGMRSGELNREAVEKTLGEEWPKSFVFSEKFNKGLYKIIENVQNRKLNQRLNKENIDDITKNVIKNLDKPVKGLKGEIDNLRVENVQENIESLRKKEAIVEKIILDIFETTKAMNHGLPINFEEKDLSYILRQICAEHDSIVRKSKNVYDIDIQEKVFKTKIDAEKFYEVISILLENAEKHSLEKSRIYIKAGEDGEKFKIEVKNVSREKLDINSEDLAQMIINKDVEECTGLSLERCKALTKKLKGKMSIFIDGDLFKVVLQFGGE